MLALITGMLLILQMLYVIGGGALELAYDSCGDLKRLTSATLLGFVRYRVCGNIAVGL